MWTKTIKLWLKSVLLKFCKTKIHQYEWYLWIRSHPQFNVRVSWLKPRVASSCSRDDFHWEEVTINASHKHLWGVKSHLCRISQPKKFPQSTESMTFHTLFCWHVHVSSQEIIKFEKHFSTKLQKFHQSNHKEEKPGGSVMLINDRTPCLLSSGSCFSSHFY